jgi:hypothetical protein
MTNNSISEFAEVLVRNVRDAVIQNCDSMLHSHSMAPVARRWQQTGIDPGILRVVIPDVVDETIFTLLQMIDEGSLKMKFLTNAGNEVDLTVDGMSELAGWYMGSGGWRAQYAGERFVDDFADMAKGL